MIPVLYEGNEREFITQGIGSLKDAISCKVTEELNGAYELVMEYPAFGELFSEIKLGRLILAEPAPHRETEPFSIYKISKPINGIVTINAEHISYRLSYIPVSPFSAENCVAALNGLASHALEECPFKVWTDKNVNAKFELLIPQSFRLCLGGKEGSILDTYKGEYEFNRFNVKLHTHRGTLKDSAKIIYGRNLVDLTQEESIEKTVTGIIPYWKGSATVSNSDDTTTTTEKVVVLPEYIVKSEYSGKYPYERTIVYDFSSDFQNEPTVDELRERCEQYMKDNLTGVPDVTLTINFASLADYEENKGVSDQIVYLGDSVPVLFDKYDIATTAKIVSVEYDTIEERYNTITLGNTSASLSKSISQIDQKQNETITKSDLEMSLILAQKILAGGEGGYIVTKYVNGHPAERVIGDTDDIKTMVNCFRYNKNGIGVSNNGFNGPYISAWTIDGRFNADFIAFGELNGNLIKARTIYVGALDDGVTSTIESAQSSADSAKDAADSANSAALNAQERANDAYVEAQKAQQNADSANRLADNAWQGIDDLKQVVSIGDEGVKVKESANSSNYSHIKSDGMHVIVGNQEVAKFGRESHIDNLAVSEFMMFGAHRCEFLRKFREDGTAFYWVGDVN